MQLETLEQCSQKKTSWCRLIRIYSNFVFVFKSNFNLPFGNYKKTRCIYRLAMVNKIKTTSSWRYRFVLIEVMNSITKTERLCSYCPTIHVMISSMERVACIDFHKRGSHTCWKLWWAEGGGWGAGVYDCVFSRLECSSLWYSWWSRYVTVTSIFLVIYIHLFNKKGV